ncbi:PREDICTED: mitogen-activated protein kinase kinase kinase YODA-like [Camelina sativa]|uniref:Mitogen-activated protein kinase kinase kinase YODA-like n=1 Tax=Camelina sativa TaxID=90675 RepID=A0ABM0ZAW3_CAMSA|nr:PREDICTED: mitogen-activated protein kinase kinase kinase YODA-like [Camelina sativa]
MEQIIGDLNESSLETVCLLGKCTDGFVSLKKDSNLEKSYVKKTCILKQSKTLEKELRIMLRFHNNPFIVQASSDHLHYVTHTKVMSLCYIYMEYASLGNLDKMISDAGGRLPEDSVRRATRMILQGLKALHSQGYVHCDLNPTNVLVFPSNTLGEPWDVKLAGFRLSKEPTMDSSLFIPGSLEEYMPPEAIEWDTFVGPNKLTGPARDIWSLGRLVLKMFGGVPVDVGGSSNTWRLYEDISPEATDFVRRCLAGQTSDRATVDELLDYPFAAEKRPLYLSFLRFPSIIRKIAREKMHREREELIPKPQGLFW